MSVLEIILYVVIGTGFVAWVILQFKKAKQKDKKKDDEEE